MTLPQNMPRIAFRMAQERPCRLSRISLVSLTPGGLRSSERLRFSLSSMDFKVCISCTMDGFPLRTVETIIKKLVDLKKLTKIGEGRTSRYRVLPSIKS